MNRAEAWTLAYSRQASADMLAYDALECDDKVSHCESLHMLQMACEKLCKAHLCANNCNPTDLQSSHKYIAKNLPVVVSQYVTFHRMKTRRPGGNLLRQIRQLAREIELLAPTVNDGGKRPDNCEYPWEDASGEVHVPADYGFPNLGLLKAPAGITLLKIVRWAIDGLSA